MLEFGSHFSILSFMNIRKARWRVEETSKLKKEVEFERKLRLNAEDEAAHKVMTLDEQLKRNKKEHDDQVSKLSLKVDQQ
jgi:hypothetical protein